MSDPSIGDGIETVERPIHGIHAHRFNDMIAKSGFGFLALLSFLGLIFGGEQRTRPTWAEDDDRTWLLWAR